MPDHRKELRGWLIPMLAADDRDGEIPDSDEDRSATLNAPEPSGGGTNRRVERIVEARSIHYENVPEHFARQ